MLSIQKPVELNELDLERTSAGLDKLNGTLQTASMLGLLGGPNGTGQGGRGGFGGGGNGGGNGGGPRN